MSKAKKLLCVCSLGILFSGCCLPTLPLCNECITNGILALSALANLLTTVQPV
jgi:hypothetical protein